MKNTYLLFGLRRLYAQTLGYIRAGEDRAADLAHIAHVIRLVAPDTDLAAIRPVRPYKPHRHEWSRAALDILRVEGRPMAARELARRVIVSEGGEASDLSSVECCLHAVLGRLEGQGVIRAQGSPKRWRVAP